MNEISAESVDVRFPGDARFLPAIRALVREILVDERGEPIVADIPKMLLAVQEACVNAIRHGHGGDASRPVGLTVRDRPEVIEILVSDDGEGFHLPEDLGFERSLTAESGRGLAIMRAVMDEVSVRREGGATVLSLVKRKAGR